VTLQVIEPTGARNREAREHIQLPLRLTELFNNVAFTGPDTLGNGRLNVWGNSLPIGTLPAGRIRVSGVEFDVAAPDGVAPDNVRCTGQLVHLPDGTAADWLHLLVTSERRCEETVHLHYASGAVDPEWIRVSDFWPATGHFGEVLAARSAGMHYPHHIQPDLGGQVWSVRVPAVRREPLRSVRLPDNAALHLFALTVEGVR
jgi:hypothetical protein